MTDETRGIDLPAWCWQEIEIIQVCVTALQQLEREAALRALAYMLSRFGERNVSDHVYNLARAQRQFDAAAKEPS